ncbi:MAG: four-carbon acid sugar kinase family protein [Sphaerochaetaceae bacterium]
MDLQPLKHIVLADDLTGANDSGVHFLSEHGKVIVNIDPRDGEPLSFAQTTIINTDSRLLTPKQAYDKLYGITSSLPKNGPTIIFKKIDSTLRGNIGSEIDALIDAGGFSLVCVASASPRNGRTVSNGFCYVDGIPLAETEIANDLFNPVHSSSIKDILTTQTSRPIGLIELPILRSSLQSGIQHIKKLITEGKKIVVADSENSDDLRRIKDICSMIDAKILYVGSAGLFHALKEGPLVSTKGLSSPLSGNIFICHRLFDGNDAETSY